MKNNTRYKGNTNYYSVIIFFLKSKTPSDGTLNLAGRTSSKVFVMLVIVLHFMLDLQFIVVSSFSCYIIICRCYFILLLFFIHILFLTSYLTLPWTIDRFLHPFYTLAQHIAEWFPTLSFFQPFRYLLAASPTALSGHFLPTGVFYLALLHGYFNLRLSSPPRELVVLPWSLQGFILIFKT